MVGLVLHGVGYRLDADIYVCVQDATWDMLLLTSFMLKICCSLRNRSWVSSGEWRRLNLTQLLCIDFLFWLLGICFRAKRCCR
jgi:hypothetical protein